jgi:hypothetical protein
VCAGEITARGLLHLHDEQEQAGPIKTAFSAVEDSDSAVTAQKVLFEFRKPGDSPADTIPGAATAAASPRASAPSPVVPVVPVAVPAAPSPRPATAASVTPAAPPVASPKNQVSSTKG